MKKKVRLTESQLTSLIKKTVNKVLKEDEEMLGINPTDESDNEFELVGTPMKIKYGRFEGILYQFKLLKLQMSRLAYCIVIDTMYGPVTCIDDGLDERQRLVISKMVESLDGKALNDIEIPDLKGTKSKLDNLKIR